MADDNAAISKSKAEAAAGDASVDKRAGSVWMAVVVWTLRVIVGAVFVFSGWVKVIDIWGVVYKVEEYMAAMGFALPRPLTLMSATVLAVAEFTLGVMVVCGIFRRVTPWLLTVFMIVMTPLTIWIFIADPVADCGCFGEALIISNGATLGKNIVLLAAAVLLLFWNSRIAPLYIPRLQWLPLTASVLYAGYLAMYGYNVQPLCDFRPFPVGKALSQSSPEPMYQYERDGVIKWFSADSLPGEDWTYISREVANNTAADGALSVFDEDGEDVSDELFANTDNGLLLLAVAETRRHGISRSQMANALNKYITSRGGEMAAVVASSRPRAWAEAVRAGYPVYSADDTEIKELARGEAALIYIRRDTIRWKYALSALDPDMVTEDGIMSGTRPSGAGGRDLLVTMQPAGADYLLAKITGAYLALMLAVLSVSLGFVHGHNILPRKKK